MCYSEKSSFAAWVILTVFAFMLLYRCEKYDRVFILFVFGLRFVQLLEYGIYRSADPYQCGKLMFVVLFLQGFFLSLGLLSYAINLNSPSFFHFSLVFLLFSFIMFFWSIFYVVTVPDKSIYIYDDGNHIKWVNENFSNHSFLGDLKWIYLFQLLYPFAMLLIYNYYDVGLWILLTYGIGSLIFSVIYYQI